MKVATAAGAAGFFSSLASQAHSQSPNERPGIGFIGTGIRFHTYHGDQALRHGHCPALADVDSLQLGRAYQVVVDNHRKYRYPLVIDAHEDYRHVLDNKDVDVVCIASVDHWHTKIAIDAMKAGKDVYCEKPLTLTIQEGQQIIDVLKATGRVFQVGRPVEDLQSNPLPDNAIDDLYGGDTPTSDQRYGYERRPESSSCLCC